MIHLHPTTDEWQAAFDAVVAADPSETDERHGVALVISGGQRSWIAWSDDITVRTMAFDADGSPEMVVTVSRRLIAFARPLAHLGDVTLTLDRAHAVVSGAGNSLRLDHPRVESVPQPRWSDQSIAVATLSAHALNGLLVHGGVLPAGLDLDGSDEPSFDVAITSTGLVATVDWSPLGLPATKLEMAAATSGSATRSVWFAGARRLLAITPPDADVEVVVPASGPGVIVRSAAWSAVLPTMVEGAVPQLDQEAEHGQLDLFGGDEGVQDTVRVEGAYPVGYVDRFEGRSLTDVRALAIDPDPEVRFAAASSRWNVDARLQRVLATDPDERVVLALLDRVDPYVDVCQLIIAGPHVDARRELARRNLRRELLELLADDVDPTASAAAAAELARRAGRIVEFQGSTR